MVHLNAPVCGYGLDLAFCIGGYACLGVALGKRTSIVVLVNKYLEVTIDDGLQLIPRGLDELQLRG